MNEVVLTTVICFLFGEENDCICACASSLLPKYSMIPQNDLKNH